jgi:hypothetical protein
MTVTLSLPRKYNNVTSSHKLKREKSWAKDVNTITKSLFHSDFTPIYLSSINSWILLLII